MWDYISARSHEDAAAFQRELDAADGQLIEDVRRHLAGVRAPTDDRCAKCRGTGAVCAECGVYANCDHVQAGGRRVDCPVCYPAPTGTGNTP